MLIKKNLAQTENYTKAMATPAKMESPISEAGLGSKHAPTIRSSNNNKDMPWHRS